MRKALLLVFLCGALLALPAARSEKTAPYEIHIDVESKTLTLFRNAEPVKQYTVATGAWNTPTPLGVFTVNSRFSGEMGGFGTCFLGLNVPWGHYGIHGTNKPESIGSNASHGCIRMRVKDAEELYAAVPNGTKVIIQCGPYGELGTSLRPLQEGDRSSMVCAVQRKLRALGFYHSWPDGIYGAATQQAVTAARKALGLPPGHVDWALYQAIGLTLFE